LPTVLDQATIMSEFNTFKMDFNRKYMTPAEEAKRLAIFTANLQFILSHNQRFAMDVVTFEVGVNQFADMTNEEFVKVANGYRIPTEVDTNATTYLSPNFGALPASVDWRPLGYVTPVKDQGQCGSCWSFSATGSLEGQHFKKTNQLVSLSEQNLVDCSGKYGNMGCNGGWPYQAYNYIKDNKGIDTEASYKYEAIDDKCRYNAANSGATCTGYVSIQTGSEAKLQDAVANIGPISVAIDASHMSFQLYKKGMYIEPMCSTTRLDHAVLAVGYGTTTDGQDFWTVKNSWAESWGDKGYIQMARNHKNMCGIATSACYPLV
jgi:cathepsin L